MDRLFGIPRVRLSCIAFLGLLAASAAQAQIISLDDTTSPPIPGVGHDYIRTLSDTVNPANGSVSVNIRLPLPNGRGISLPFSIIYNSNPVYHVIANPGNGFGEVVDNLGYAAGGGWAYSVPTMNYSSWSVNDPTHKLICSYATNYMFQDPGGGQHQLGLGSMQSLAGPGCKFSGLEYPNGGDSQVLSTLTDGLVVTDIHGTTYDFFHSPSTLPLPSLITDRNGNQISLTNSGSGQFTVKDTLGRTLVSSTGFGPAGQTKTISTPQGNYQITWESVASNFNLPNSKVTSLSDSTCVFPTPQRSVTVISSITLPNLKQYQFHYDPTYGLLDEIDYPTGGWVKYSYTTNVPLFELAVFTAPNGGGCVYQYAIPVVATRQVSFTGSATNLTQAFSLTNTWSSDDETWTARTATVTTTDPILGSAQTSYSYAPHREPNQPYSPAWPNNIPVESEIQYYDWNNNSTPLETVTKGWYDQYLLECQFETLNDGSASGGFYNYSYGQVSDHLEFDFGQITSPSSVCYNNAAWPTSPRAARETVTTFQSFAGPFYVTLGLGFGRPSSVVVKDSSGNPAAETDYSYDGSSVSQVTAVQHDDTDYGTSFNFRGNRTNVTRKCTGCTNALTTYTYDMTGQVLSKTDPCGNTTCGDITNGTSFTTSYSYTDSYSIGTPPGSTNAYVTTVTLPTVNGVTAHEYYKYRYDDGQLTFSQDQNQHNAGGTVGTSYTFNDSLHRLTQANYPDGGQTSYAYNDSAYNPSTPSPSVTTTTEITSTLNEQTVGAPDGLGHLVETILSTDPDGATYTNTLYYGTGKVYKQYNPYRSSSDPTYGVTSYVYDGLGRLCLVVPPDVGSVPTSCPASHPAGAKWTTYSGPCTSVTDEAGNSRKSCVDGLGRLTGVWEDPSGRNYETDYTYDALGNLLNVTQKGGASSGSWRIRSFQYDSLSRLTSATNPESGTTQYTYDANGNVATRVMPQANQTGTAQTTTSYTYDALNRLLLLTHSNPSNAQSAYSYDGTTISGCPGVAVPTITSPTNLIGRRSAMCSQQSASAFSYDQMGRVISEARTNGLHTPPPITYTTGYQYNLDGSLYKLTYPSGDVVTYTVGAAGRVTQVSDATNNFVVVPATLPMYAPQGALVGMKQGSGIVTANIYNSRLQPVLLSAGPTAGAVVSLCFDFHLKVAINNSPCQFAASTGDNGDLFQAINNIDSTRSATFAYDSLNRVTQANTVNTTSANCWGEAYTIDAWGNLTNIVGAPGIGGNCYTETLNAAPANIANQLNGYCYDAAGNLLLNTPCPNGSFTPTYEYDAENRLYNPQATYTYSYDAEGVRIRKASPSAGTFYWPAPNGEYLTEADGMTGNINEEYIYFNGQRIARIDRPSGTPHYYFSDQLGSASVITDVSGNVQERYFYYPYGGLVASIGSDANHYKFTGKQRDSETGEFGLDNFGARYYASTMGRFMTPDWAARPTEVPYAVFGDPQTLNLYTYVQNAPLNRADADGHVAGSPVLPNPSCEFSGFDCDRGCAMCFDESPSTMEVEAEAQFNATVHAAFAQAQNQTQTKQLTADDVSKAAKTYDSDKGDKNPARLVKALDTLGTDFTGTGATVQSGAKESGVKMPGAAEKVLGNVDSISRSGDTVTITNQKSITVDGVAKLDKTISFKVVSVDGKPALHDISGIHLGVGKGWAFVVLDTPKSWGP